MTILLDGAMGTELERRGARTGAPLWSAHALLDAPDLVSSIHLDYLRAGAQVITTNTFRTHARNLAPAGLGERAGALTHLAVQLACQARDLASAADPTAGRAVIAGSIPPLEDSLAPERSPARQRAFLEHRAHARHLAQAGCDLLLVETLGRVDEAYAACDAAFATGLPVWLAVVGRADGKLLGGETFHDLITELAPLPIGALLLNCTQLTHLPALLPPLLHAAERAPHLALGLYPHTGAHDPQRGWCTHATDPQGLTEALAAAQRASPRLTLLGACCGSTPAWIAELARRFHPTADDRRAGFAELDRLLARGAPPDLA